MTLKSGPAPDGALTISSTGATNVAPASRTRRNGVKRAWRPGAASDSLFIDGCSAAAPHSR